jgi:probable rRNA maturation factor
VKRSLTLSNRQRREPVDTRLLRRLARALLQDLLGVKGFELGVCLVSGKEITRLNEQFLRHAGETDVIAFDYLDDPQPEQLAGEIFICVDQAVAQARRYRTSWQSELVRYLTHGILHLRGYDDHQAAERRRMKREEDRLVKELGARFSFGKIGGHRQELPLKLSKSFPAPKVESWKTGL